MTIQEEYCDKTHRVVTRTYAATFDDVIFCIRNVKIILINIPAVVDGKVQVRQVMGYFSKYNQDGIHFYEYDGQGKTYSIGHEYTDYLEFVE